MTDIESERWLWIKGVLFLFIGIIATSLLMLELPSTKLRLLVVVAIWGFCRSYYFAFYVIEKYADPSFRFAGLIYVPQYVYRRWNQLEPMAGDRTQANALSWYIQWPINFAFVRLGAHEITVSWMMHNSLFDMLIWTIDVVLLAYLSLVGAFGPFKMETRMVLTYVLLAVLMLIGGSRHSIALLDALVLITLPLAFFTSLRGLTGNLFIANHFSNHGSTIERSSRSPRNAVWIRLFFGAIVGAVGFAIATQVTWSEIQSFFSRREIQIQWIASLLIAPMTYSLVHMVMGTARHRKRHIRIALFGIVAFPCLILQFANSTSSTTEIVSVAYLFILTYVGCLGGILLHARSLGIRFRCPSNENPIPEIGV